MKSSEPLLPAAAPTMDDQRPSTVCDRVLLAAILCSAFLMRLGYAYYNRDDFRGGNGADLTIPLARSIARGDGYTLDGRTAHVFKEPGYPVMVASAIRLGGENWWSFACLHGTIGTLLVLMTWLAARAVFGVKSATFSAAIVAAYPYLVMHGMSVTDTVPCALFIMGFVFCGIHALRGHTALWTILTGLTLGVGLLVRGSILALLPLPLLATVRRQSGLQWSLARSALLLASIALPVSPWVLRNYFLTGALFISTHGAGTLWIMNHDMTLPLIENNVALDAICWSAENRNSELRLSKFFRASPTESMVMRDKYQREGYRLLRKNYARLPRLMCYNAMGFWSVNYNPRLWDGTPIPAPKQWGHRLSYGSLLFFGLAGIGSLRKRWRREHTFLVLVIAFYFLPHAAVWGVSRARLPLDPVFALFAGFGVLTLGARFGTFLHRFSAKRYRWHAPSRGGLME